MAVMLAMAFAAVALLAVVKAAVAMGVTSVAMGVV